MRVKLPIPERARASHTYPPTPPIPNIAICFLDKDYNIYNKLLNDVN